MKILKISIIFICTLFLSACFNYTDINKLFFATATLIDVDEFGNPVVYTEAFKAYRGEVQENGSEIRVIFKSTGKTIYETSTNSALSASNEINSSQIKALIFTEKALKKGLDKFIDIYNRSQKPSMRIYLFVYTGGDPEGFINTKIKDEQFLGLYLDDLMNSEGRIGSLHRVRLNEFLNRRSLGSAVQVLPILDRNRSNPDRIEIQGVAVLKNNKMVSKLTLEEVVPYNYTMHNGTRGFLLADNPNEKGEYVTLKVLNSTVRFNIDYDGKKVLINKRLRIKASLIEAQRSSFILNDSIRKEIEESASDKLKKKIEQLFQESKKQDVDIFNIANRFNVMYPDSSVQNVLAIAQLGHIDVKVNIEGSVNTTDFR